MVFQLDSGIYERAAASRRADEQLRLNKERVAQQAVLQNRRLDLSERLMGLNEKKAESAAGLNAERIKSEKIERAAKYLSMATPENWSSVRQTAISEGLGDETTLPLEYDENWMANAKQGLLGVRPTELPADVRTHQYFESLDPDKQGTFSSLFGKSSKPSALEQKIATLVESGVGENTAKGIATGRYVVSRDPVSGQATIVDKAASGGGAAAMPPASETPPAPSAADASAAMPPAVDDTEATGLFADAELGTGLLSGAVSVASNVAGQLDDQFVSNPTIQARQRMNTFRKAVQRAMSVNPERPTVFDLEQIDKLYGGASLKAPEVVRQELGVLRDSMLTDLDLSKQNMNDRTLPAKFRQQEAERVKLLEQALQMMGRPAATKQPLSRGADAAISEIDRILQQRGEQ